MFENVNRLFGNLGMGGRIILILIKLIGYLRIDGRIILKRMLRKWCDNLIPIHLVPCSGHWQAVVRW
jgi:hypothetical protein